MKRKWLATALAMAVSLLLAFAGFAQDKVKPQRVTFAVDGKGEWADKVRTAFEKVDGVTKSDLLVKDKQVRVEYQPFKVTTHKLARALADAGVNGRLLLRVDGMS